MRVREGKRRYRDSSVQLLFRCLGSLAQRRGLDPRTPMYPRGDDIASLSQPLQQRRNMDLVGLVVASERVHHDVDAGAEGEFALARLGGNERQHGLPVLA